MCLVNYSKNPFIILLLSKATGKKKATPGGPLDQALERMCKRTRELRGQVDVKFFICWKGKFME